MKLWQVLRDDEIGLTKVFEVNNFFLLDNLKLCKNKAGNARARALAKRRSNGGSKSGPKTTSKPPLLSFDSLNLHPEFNYLILINKNEHAGGDESLFDRYNRE